MRRRCITHKDITKKKISDAFASLIKEKNVEDISVGEIVSAADVGKSTFYRYYHDIYDIFEELTDAFASRVINVMVRLVFSEDREEYCGYNEIISFDEAMTMFGLETSDKILVDYLFRNKNMKTFHLVVERFRSVVKDYAAIAGIDAEQADYYTRFVMNGVLYSSLTGYRDNGTFNMHLIDYLLLFTVGNATERGGENGLQ